MDITNQLNLDMFDETFLQRSMQLRMEATKTADSSTYQQMLHLNDNEKKMFLNTLSISYSEFFRNTLTFAVLEKIILPELVQKAIRNNHKTIQIWSMACASGQEVYSLAMLLEEYLENAKVPVRYRIFASDQSASEIKICLQGCYSKEALTNLNSKRLSRWFTYKNDRYCVRKQLQKNVDFSVFDLISENHVAPTNSIIADFDLIFCANLLFYYKPAYQDVILNKARHALSRNGYLVTGEVERPLLKRNLFVESYPFSAIFNKLP